LQRKYGELSPIPCTKCGYCAPCPNGVDIPRNFELYNDATLFGGNAMALCKNLYASLPAEQKAAACAACGTCEEKCPQQIEIAAMMPRVEAALGTR
jgi:predicted aldo/keto reductase-like oxidoreductase